MSLEATCCSKLVHQDLNHPFCIVPSLLAITSTNAPMEWHAPHGGGPNGPPTMTLLHSHYRLLSGNPSNPTGLLAKRRGLHGCCLSSKGNMENTFEQRASFICAYKTKDMEHVPHIDQTRACKQGILHTLLGTMGVM